MKAGNKVIVDTNIWINFLINRKQNFIENYFLYEGLILLFSNESINELFQLHKEINSESTSHSKT